MAVQLGDLVLDPANARRHPDRNLAAVKASLIRFGQLVPIVVQREGMIVRAGNGRLEAARELEWTHLAAVVVDQDNVTAVAFAIADNRTAELASWDYDALGLHLEAIRDEGFELEDLGWESHEWEPLLTLPPEDPPPGDPPDTERGKSKQRQITLDEEQLQRVHAAIAVVRQDLTLVAEGEAVATICDEWVAKR